MLAHVMEIVEKDGNFDAVLLHVQINNDSAIKFYKRSGFDIVETKEQVCMQGCCAHRENQSAEAAAINTVCKPRSLDGRLLCFGICANQPHKTFPKRTLLS